MAKMALEGLEALIDKVNGLGEKGEIIKRKALDKAGEIVKESMEKKAPRSKDNKEHMADHIKVSDIRKGNGIDYVDIGPKKGDTSKFYYSKFTEFGTSTIPAQHWAEKSVKGNKRKINEAIKAALEKGLNALD